jgi:hypothetical protein
MNFERRTSNFERRMFLQQLFEVRSSMLEVRCSTEGKARSTRRGSQRRLSRNPPEPRRSHFRRRQPSTPERTARVDREPPPRLERGEMNFERRTSNFELRTFLQQLFEVRSSMLEVRSSTGGKARGTRRWSQRRLSRNPPEPRRSHFRRRQPSTPERTARVDREPPPRLERGEMNFERRTSNFELRTSNVIPQFFRIRLFNVRSSKLNVRRSMFEVRSSKFDVRSSTFDVRCSKFNVRSSTFNVRSSTFEVRCSIGGDS